MITVSVPRDASMNSSKMYREEDHGSKLRKAVAGV
jgi:hypothetical protein